MALGDAFPAHYRQYYCKGNYYAYSRKTLVSRLIYPVPEKNLKVHYAKRYTHTAHVAHANDDLVLLVRRAWACTSRLTWPGTCASARMRSTSTDQRIRGPRPTTRSTNTTSTTPTRPSPSTSQNLPPHARTHTHTHTTHDTRHTRRTRRTRHMTRHSSRVSFFLLCGSQILARSGARCAVRGLFGDSAQARRARRALPRLPHRGGERARLPRYVDTTSGLSPLVRKPCSTRHAHDTHTTRGQAW